MRHRHDDNGDDALVTRLVEGAVGEGEDVGTQDLVQEEVVGLVGLQLLNQLVHQPPQLRLARLGDERLLEHYLVDQHLHVSAGSAKQARAGVGSALAVATCTMDTGRACSAHITVL